MPKKIAMSESFPPATAEALTAFEQEHNIHLPADFREFLLQYNGGRPEVRRFKFAGTTKGSSIHTLYGLLGEDEEGNLEDEMDVFKGRLPTGFLTIGSDDGGNQICLVLGGANKGKVYFWDHEEEADPDSDETPDTVDNTVLIANSFQEFLIGLY